MNRPSSPNYNKCYTVEDYIKACEKYESDITEYCTEIEIYNAELEEYCDVLEERCSVLGKALDKACEKLFSITEDCPYDAHNIYPPNDCETKCKEGIEPKCWKEFIRRRMQDE